MFLRPFWRNQPAFQLDVSDHYKHHQFLPHFFPLLSTFLTDGVLNKKNYLVKVGSTQNLGVDTFSDPVGHFGAP